MTTWCAYLPAPYSKTGETWEIRTRGVLKALDDGGSDEQDHTVVLFMLRRPTPKCPRCSMHTFDKARKHCEHCEAKKTFL
jgi:hypothetical protein